MSAGIDQRTKGQPHAVSNGPGKEPMKEEFDAYLSQQQQQQPKINNWSGGYSSAPMSSPSEAPYMPNYYPSMSFPYLGQGGLSEGAWSNGGDPMSFLGGYGQMNSDYMSSSGMFSGFSYQPGFSWEFPGGDYSAWGTSNTQGRKNDDRAVAAAAYSDAYYMGPMDGYGGGMNGEIERDMKAVEQGLKGVNITGDRGDPAKDPHMVDCAPVQPTGPIPGMAPPPKKTWASIASQPAKPQMQLKPKSIPRAPVLPSKHNMDIGTWDNKGSSGKQGQQGQARQPWGSIRGRSANYNNSGGSSSNSTSNGGNGNGNAANGMVLHGPSHPVLDRLRIANQYNPKEFNLNPKGARYFIIKSYSEDDIHRSIKYSIWCSTEHGNKRVDAAYREREGKGPLYLFFSVNGSGHFCGMTQMMSPLDYNASSDVWAQDKWKGQFEVKWIYVKDVPNSQLRHIRLENNENKPVTNSRDTQEVPPEKGKQVLKIMHNYRHSTSIFDDFSHYEKRQEEDQEPPLHSGGSSGGPGGAKKEHRPPRQPQHNNHQ